jgi:hypothetical protein
LAISGANWTLETGSEIFVPPSSHFIFIPGVLVIGVVVGWILGSRAARDAYMAELKRREARQKERAKD